MLAGLLAVVALAAPAAAHAESLAITPGSDPVAGLPSGVGYDYDTSGATLNLVVVTRLTSGPQCGPTSAQDATIAGSSGTTYLTPTPLELTGAGLGRVPFTWTAPGTYRVCAWLSRSPDDAVNVISAEVDVRGPRASIALTAEESAARAGGADIVVKATGTSEAPADLLVSVVSVASACPPTYDENTDPVALDVSPAGTATRVTGAFALQFHTGELLAFRRWRICAYLQDGTTAASAGATAATLIDLFLRPALLSRPRVRQKGHAITCDGGRWKARPTARYTYTWLVGAKRLPGAKGRPLPVTAAVRGRAVRCRVSARNRLGAASATSKPVTAR